ncbi:TetR/AcrR family transcriptional regulator [Crossiella sp. CA-258035]|uniref:TetR/AcrR family transcriptional regulator n=1 Tax=Crossiella sp. CA-258035 TaxID=2981138 RepID=UPI0024BC9642|nr:TetR/AcrR family transcriptional regulator [Crossiella sp. CA-258035]WHT20518.1 TetR/AcrR family transcriptional regulator [Crossiella sp. CA-258035]
MSARRTPTGAAVLQPQVTAAITEAVLDELAGSGYGRLSMEAVAKRAGVGKSALYRRWPAKQDMVLAAMAELSVPMAPAPDTGSLRGDLRVVLTAVQDWLTHPRVARILPDLIAESGRSPELATAMAELIGEPRRARGATALRRAIERGELPPDTDLELALDLLAAPVYWRVVARRAPQEDHYLESVVEFLLRGLSVRAPALTLEEPE